eukprot:5992199-Prymnesium_polylepis.1
MVRLLYGCRAKAKAVRVQLYRTSRETLQTKRCALFDFVMLLQLDLLDLDPGGGASGRQRGPWTAPVARA